MVLTILVVFCDHSNTSIIILKVNIFEYLWWVTKTFDVFIVGKLCEMCPRFDILTDYESVIRVT